jgi:hypothetical protein
VSPRTKKASSAKSAAERRTNLTLREALEDLLGHARDVARRAKNMTPQELEYAEERLEWLADEVWRIATGGAKP